MSGVDFELIRAHLVGVGGGGWGWDVVGVRGRRQMRTFE